MSENCLPADRKYCRGEKHPRAKLTANQVHEIRSRLKAGEVQKEVAKSYGVSEVAINHIHCGRRWKHITVGESV